MQLNLQAFVSILDNVHNTATNIFQDEVAYANITFAFCGYISNFSNISIKSANLDENYIIYLVNGYRIKVENAYVLIRYSSTIDFYGKIVAIMFFCTEIDLSNYSLTNHNVD